MKIVINKCFGGFGLSHAAIMRYAEIKGITLYPFLDDIERKIWADEAYVGNPKISHSYTTKPVIDGNYYAEGSYFSVRDIERNDPALVQVVEELGELADGRYAELAVVEVPDNVAWEIDKYDGIETIAEVHRIWG